MEAQAAQPPGISVTPTTLVAAALALVGLSFLLFCACHRERRCPLHRPEESPVVAVVHSLAEPSGPSPLVMGQVVGIGEPPDAVHSATGASANPLLLPTTTTAMIDGALPHVGRTAGKYQP